MRVAAALLLLALSAGAEEMVVRVTVGDEPLPDAGVAVQPRRPDGPSFRADRFAPQARTDATGQAVVEASDEDQVLVYVPGYELAVVAGGGRLADVALRPERIFSGRVVDTRGEPVVGASVLLGTTFRRRAEFAAVSGEQGWFHVYGLWFDDYALQIEASGFLPWDTGPASVTERDGGKTFVLWRLAAIAGTVRDHRGEAVAGAEVRLSTGETARTGEGGTYRIGGLAPAIEYTVAFPPPWGGQAGPLTLDEGEVREGVDVVRLAPVTLRLRVVDAEGRRIEGITADPSLRGLPDTASDSKGSIELLVPPQRDGEIQLRGKEFESVNLPWAAAPPGATQDLGDVLLRAVPEIEVRVRLPDGTPPAAGAIGSVPLVGGVARVKGAGVYAVSVPGYPTVLPYVEPPGPVVVTLPTPQWIEGIVLDPDGGPVAGAQVTAQDVEVAAVRADRDGRFRIGPFATGPVWIEATTPTARSREVQVVLGGGELELTVLATQPALLRGRVLRGVRPVTRFSIEHTRVVDEEGRFEILLLRADKDWVEVETEAGSHAFRLPPEGQELIARLPGGSVAVALEGAVPGRIVSLVPVGGLSGPCLESGPDGIALFSDLEPGVYAAQARGFVTTEVTLAADADQRLALPATPQGLLSVRPAPGLKFDGDLGQTLNPGVHRDVLAGHGAYRVFLEAVRIVAGEETVVDLAPPDAGSLLVRGPPGTWVELELKRPDAALLFGAPLDEADGAFRFPLLPPGPYTVRTPLRRLEIGIAAGEATVLDLPAGAQVVADRVLLQNGKPAQGAAVYLLPSDDPGRERSLMTEILLSGERTREALTDLRGRFRFADVAPGEYDCVAFLEGHAPARGAVTVAMDGVVTDGLPLTLPASADGHVTLLGLGGEPLRGVPVRVDDRWEDTDALGRLLLHAVPARIDLDRVGCASLRGLEVRAGDEIRLVRGAALIVVWDPAAPPPAVRVGGRPWRRLRPAPLEDPPEPGRLRLEDLPPGPVEIEPPARPAEEGEEQAEEPPETVVVVLESGTETTVDLRRR